VPQGPRIAVAIVEDNDVFREALEILIDLAPDLDVVVSACSGTEALEALAATPADVALVDYRLPDLDGVETTRALLDATPGLAVVALTAAADEPALEALRAAGAVDCLRKDGHLEDIVSAIRRAASP
jgi:DNA-binding NarL/FixJ family response regulator